jgi:hypothetical protein
MPTAKIRGFGLGLDLSATALQGKKGKNRLDWEVESGVQ